MPDNKTETSASALGALFLFLSLAIAPAIANAVYDAIGVRVREVPMTPQKVQALLRTKAAAQSA